MSRPLCTNIKSLYTFLGGGVGGDGGADEVDNVSRPVIRTLMQLHVPAGSGQYSGLQST